MSIAQLSQPAESANNLQIHRILNADEIANIFKLFHSKSGDQNKFRPAELRKLLNKFGITYNDNQFETLFLRINTNRDNLCDWDEFVSHLLVGFRNDDPYNAKESLNLPIEGAPLLRNAEHRYQVIRIRFCPIVMPDRSVDYTVGSYVTTSKDGTVIYWSQDFDLQHIEKSKNPNLKVSKTWILDCVPLPDVRIICTSSIERDLRFYDTMANNFNLRIVITSLPFAVNCMNYWFSQSEDINCRLILADFGGNIWQLEFSPILRGPFQNKSGAALIQLTWLELLQGKYSLFHVLELKNIHYDIIRQVEYSETLNAIFSAAECRSVGIGKTPDPGLVISDLGVQKSQTIFRMTKGVSCFAFNRMVNCIATGGPDFMLRIWNHLMPKKPIAILPGHHSGIVFITLQDNGKLIYSVDCNRFVKVWDSAEFTLLQTYISFNSVFIENNSAFTCFYDDNTREIIMATCGKFGSVKCCPLLKLDQTDGYTHSKAVSCIVYNELFQAILTCGLDSYVIVWDLATGERQTLIKRAHTRMLHGESLSVEITAACLDPKDQLLLTGARDGTLKIWNFNNGICVRNMTIEYMCEVTRVHWFPNRILAVGWNKHVIEFSDTGENELGEGKIWDTLHSEDILSTAVQSPLTLATGSYAGELVLWALETGQPIRRYNADTPTIRLKISYAGAKAELPKETKLAKSKLKSLNYLRKSYMARALSSSIAKSEQSFDMPNLFKPTKKRIPYMREMSILQLPTTQTMHCSIYSMLFLTARPVSPDCGTLLVGLQTGNILIYSHHLLGGYLKSFQASHMTSDCVTHMTTDKENKYLITGTALGYVKTWLIWNYCYPENEKRHINMPELRLQFPFLIKDRFEGRAKRSARQQKLPMLINSYRAHLAAISTIIFIDKTKLVITAAADKTVRIWTLSGLYIGTFGSPIRWPHLSMVHQSLPAKKNNNRDDVQNKDNVIKYRVPPDVQRVASSTTLKVFNGGYFEDPLAHFMLIKKRKEQELQSVVKEGLSLEVYGKPIEAPIFRQHIVLPLRDETRINPKLDTSLNCIPIYSHLNSNKGVIIERPSTPELLTKTKQTSFMTTKK